MAIFHSNGWKFFFDLPCVKRWEFWVMFLLLYCITYCSPPVLKSFRHFPHTTGDFETSSLPCLAWWDWFLSRWPAKSYPLSVICVRFQAPFCFSSFCNVSLVTNIFFHLFQLSKKYYCNLYWWVYYIPLLVFHKENLFELSQFLIPLYLSNSWLIILSLFTVAPICYAHLAASQMGQFIKFEDSSDTSITSAGSVPVPELPRLHKNVESSMFFCWDTDCFS